MTFRGGSHYSVVGDCAAVVGVGGIEAGVGCVNGTREADTREVKRFHAGEISSESKTAKRTSYRARVFQYRKVIPGHEMAVR